MNRSRLLRNRLVAISGMAGLMAAVAVGPVAADTFVMTTGNTALGRGAGVASSTFAGVPGTAGVQFLAAGSGGVVIVMANGTLKTWGYNMFGELMADTAVPTTVPGYTQVRQVVCGSYFAVVLLANGTVCASGLKVHGPQLVQNPLTPIPELTNVTAVACGADHTLALLADGTVKAFGYNYYGQLGTGTTADHDRPVTIPGLAGVTAIGCGAWHSFARLADGSLVTWGWNTFHELGREGDNTTPLPCGLAGATSFDGGNFHSVAALADGTVKGWGYNGPVGSQLWLLGFDTPDFPWDQATPRLIPGLDGVVEIRCGDNCTLARRQDNTVLGFGWNGLGQLGMGHTADVPVPAQVPGLGDVRQMACGSEFSAVLVERPGAFSGAVDMGQGWRWLPWFGFFAPMGDFGWIWHQQHGFLCVQVESTPQSIWLYAPDMGWLWISSDLYPFLFRHADGVWIWYNGAVNPRWFRNMATGEWEARN